MTATDHAVVEPLTRREKDDPLFRPETSAEVRARVAAARERQARRYDGTGWRLNSAVPGPVLRGKGDVLLTYENEAIAAQHEQLYQRLLRR